MTRLTSSWSMNLNYRFRANILNSRKNLTIKKQSRTFRFGMLIVMFKEFAGFEVDTRNFISIRHFILYCCFRPTPSSHPDNPYLSRSKPTLKKRPFDKTGMRHQTERGNSETRNLILKKRLDFFTNALLPIKLTCMLRGTQETENLDKKRSLLLSFLMKKTFPS